MPAAQLEQAAAQVATQAGSFGAFTWSGFILGVGAFAVLTIVLAFVLKRDGTQSDRDARRDKAHGEALERAYQLVREQNQSRLEETRELARCTQAGLNGALVSIKETNAELIRGFENAMRDIRPVITESNVVIGESNAVIARAERIMDSFVVARNGHVG